MWKWTEIWIGEAGPIFKVNMTQIHLSCEQILNRICFLAFCLESVLTFWLTRRQYFEANNAHSSPPLKKWQYLHIGQSYKPSLIKNYNDSPHAYGKFQERYDSIEVPSAACSLFTQTLRKLLPFVGQNNAVLTFSSARHLCLHSKWQTVMDITDV